MSSVCSPLIPTVTIVSVVQISLSKPVVMSAYAHAMSTSRHTVDVVPEAETFVPKLLACDAGEDDPCLRRYHQSAGREEAVASAVDKVSTGRLYGTEKTRTARRNPTWLRKGAYSPERNMRTVRGFGQARLTIHSLIMTSTCLTGS
jgi:hypothetical protein